MARSMESAHGTGAAQGARVTADVERPRARGDLVFRQLGDEWVIFDPVGDRLHTLNLTAALVWTHLSGDHTPSDIAAVVGEAFTPPKSLADVERDVVDTIARFRESGLLA